MYMCFVYAINGSSGKYFTSGPLEAAAAGALISGIVSKKTEKRLDCDDSAKHFTRS